MDIKIIDAIMVWEKFNLIPPWISIFGMICWAEIFTVENLEFVLEGASQMERKDFKDFGHNWLMSLPEMEYVRRPVLDHIV